MVILLQGMKMWNIGCEMSEDIDADFGSWRSVFGGSRFFILSIILAVSCVPINASSSGTVSKRVRV